MTKNREKKAKPFVVTMLVNETATYTNNNKKQIADIPPNVFQSYVLQLKFFDGFLRGADKARRELKSKINLC